MEERFVPIGMLQTPAPEKAGLQAMQQRAPFFMHTKRCVGKWVTQALLQLRLGDFKMRCSTGTQSSWAENLEVTLWRTSSLRFHSQRNSMRKQRLKQRYASTSKRCTSSTRFPRS